jgi:hypothetical protein
MTLGPAEFMRRFLLHVLPSGFHRIRHFRPAGQWRAPGESGEGARVVAGSANAPAGNGGCLGLRHTGSAHLRMSGLRGGHGRHRNLWAWATDPRTTVAAGGVMNSARRPILTLEVHRRLPIRHRFAWRGENTQFLPVHLSRKNANVCTENDMPSRANHVLDLPEHRFRPGSRRSNPHSGIAGDNDSPRFTPRFPPWGLLQRRPIGTVTF